VYLVPRPIVSLTKNGIVYKTEEGGNSTVEVDLIVYATGFKPMLESTVNIEPLKPLSEADKFLSYWGISVPHHPNFFLLLGPNTGLGHNSIIFMIESQCNYIMECISTMIKNKYNKLVVKDSVARTWKSSLPAVAATKVWTSNCKSWYKTQDGDVYTLWPSYCTEYWWKLYLAGRNIQNEYQCE